MQFDVRHRAGYAEAIRTNALWSVRMADVANNGGRAIERATGCDIVWLQGDPSVLLAGLDCGDGLKPPRQPRGRAVCSGRLSPADLRGERDVFLSCG